MTTITNCNTTAAATSSIALSERRATCSMSIVSSFPNAVKLGPFHRNNLNADQCETENRKSRFAIMPHALTKRGLFENMESNMKLAPLWKKGDVVTIYQLSMSKGLMVEGKATVVKSMDDNGGEHYMVRFHRKDGKVEGPAYERFIDRDGQTGNEQDYIKTFNAKCGIAA